MNNKKGISLIVLVITIIVIIILAAAVILTLNNNNPIKNANQATYDSDKAEVQSALSLYIANQMAKNNGKSPLSTSADISIVDTTTTGDPALGTVTKLSWTDLGLSEKPASISSATIDKDTGKITFVPTNSALEP